MHKKNSAQRHGKTQRRKKSEDQLRVLGASVVKTTTRTIAVLALPPSPLYT
jgi:hypothetical protein